MSGAVRTAIRAAVVAAINTRLADESIVGWKVTDNRVVDIRNENKVIRVKFLDGRGENLVAGVSGVNYGELSLQLSSKSATDAELDSVADHCEAAIRDDAGARALIGGIQSTRFAFPVEDQDAFNDLQLVLDIAYSSKLPAP